MPSNQYVTFDSDTVNEEVIEIPSAAIEKGRDAIQAWYDATLKERAAGLKKAAEAETELEG